MTINEAIVDLSILGAFAQRGFTLEHPDDHVVVLIHQGQKVAQFSQEGCTQKNLQSECATHLVMEHAWAGCLWEK